MHSKEPKVMSGGLHILIYLRCCGERKWGGGGTRVLFIPKRIYSTIIRVVFCLGGGGGGAELVYCLVSC